MFLLVVNDVAAASDFLQNFLAAPTDKPVFARLYQDAAGFHLLGENEEAPNNSALYYLPENDHYKFLNTFKPAIEPEGTYQDDIILAEQEARGAIIKAAQELLDKIHADATKKDKDKVRFSQLLHINATRASNAGPLEKAIAAVPKKVLEHIASQSPVTDNSQPPVPDNEISATLAAQDALWMTQTTATNTILQNVGSKAAIALTSTSQIAGVLFGAATGVAMGVACGLLTAKIYEHRAVAAFKEKEGRKPNKEELSAIRKDARHVGLNVFGSMTGWSIGAGLMQGAFYVARTAAGFHPAGILVNVMISVAAGVGETIGACVTQRNNEKEKCKDKDGKLDLKKWEERTNSKDYAITMAKIAVSSFLGGFAWSMIGAYLPAPAQHILKAAAQQAAKAAVSIITTSLTSGLASFGIFYATSCIPAKSPKESTWTKYSPLSFFKRMISSKEEKLNPGDGSERELTR